MRSDIPKQYLDILGRPVIEHTINRLLSVDQVKGAVVSLQDDDPYWPDIRIESEKPVIVAPGGEERCHSVINALEVLSTQPDFRLDNIWALVHDAVRPCVSTDDIRQLIDVAASTDSGGLLAVPVRDTMKRQDDDQRVALTVDRTGLWHALTPQLFAWRELHDALSSALASGCLVTDESSAMEHAGHRPMLVQGSAGNIKITRPADLLLAELYIKTMSATPDTGN
jgi:2-C-methyl-D-erythritol 4-phosphate cytidylyltransferase